MENTLSIEKFLIFEKAKVNIRKFTVFIGPQASGKSIVAKLLFIFYHFPQFTFEVAVEGGKKKKLNEVLIKTFCEIFPQYAWNEKDFSICFKTEFGEICFSHKPKKRLIFSVSNYYEMLLRNIFNFASKDPAPSELNIKDISRFQSHIQNVRKLVHNSEWGFINGGGSSLFIPAGRSFFATLEKNVFSFLSSNIHIDYFLKEFGMIYENLKNARFNIAVRGENISEQFASLCKKFINGTYFRKQQKDYIRNLRKDLVVEVQDASSGQQELLPILFAMFRGTSCLFLIEEIETHIFPSSQNDIVKYIVSTQKLDFNARSFLFTTHSPYVLTIINNLAYAGLLEKRFSDVGKQDALDKLDKIYQKNERIKKGDLSAYFFDNGGVESIIDPETEIIDAEKLDAISAKTGNDFDSLVGLELEEM